MQTKLLDNAYPPTDQVVPSLDRPIKVTVEQALFTKALRQVSRVADSVRLVVNGEITLSTSHPDLGDAEVVVPVIETNHCGDDLEIGFNTSYLLDAISGADIIDLGFSNGALDPLRIDLGGGYLAVVMPTRL
jgi:DNA polymerase III sliding clamp (beta) subunit (PCNA family)